MTSAAILDLQDEKNELAAQAYDLQLQSLAALEKSQAAARSAASRFYGKATLSSLAASAAEDAICDGWDCQETFDQLIYVQKSANRDAATCLRVAAQFTKDADEIGKDIRAARFYLEARKDVTDFSEGHDVPSVPTPQDQEARADSMRLTALHIPA